MLVRKNKHDKFRLRRRGYDVNEVEAFILDEKERADEIGLAQRSRINELASRCAELDEEVKILKGKEEQIKSAFITATQNADRLTADVKARYAEELERLRLFRAKWMGAYEGLKERYHFDKDALNMESVAVSVEMELTKFLMQDFSLNRGGGENEMEEYFRSEINRLTESSRPATKEDTARSDVLELKQKIKDADLKKSTGSAAFSLDEALHPSESLEEICKALGL